MSDLWGRYVMDEPVLMTRAQWQVYEAKRECGRHGHDWQIVSNLAVPVSMHCSRPCDVGAFKIEPFRKKD